MIQSFHSRDTERLALTGKSRRWVNVEAVALKKLDNLDAAKKLEDLMVPPGNRLEKLSGDREGQHSICINKQWRICFTWQDDGAHAVEIVDYH